MPRTLRDDLRQNKPFKSLHEEAMLNVVRTSATMTDAIEEFVKPHGISSTQYNVLRILRGAEPAGLCRNELRDRMLTRMPDVTRLLDEWRRQASLSALATMTIAGSSRRRLPRRDATSSTSSMHPSESSTGV